MKNNPIIQAEQLALGATIDRVNLTDNYEALRARLLEIESNCKKVRGQLKQAFSKSSR